MDLDAVVESLESDVARLSAQRSARLGGIGSSTILTNAATEPGRKARGETYDSAVSSNASYRSSAKVRIDALLDTFAAEVEGDALGPGSPSGGFLDLNTGGDSSSSDGMGENRLSTQLDLQFLDAALDAAELDVEFGTETVGVDASTLKGLGLKPDPREAPTPPAEEEPAATATATAPIGGSAVPLPVASASAYRRAAGSAPSVEGPLDAMVPDGRGGEPKWVPSFAVVAAGEMHVYSGWEVPDESASPRFTLYLRDYELSVRKDAFPPELSLEPADEDRGMDGATFRVATTGLFRDFVRVLRRKTYAKTVEGWLEKRGEKGIRRTWKQRFFRLIEIKQDNTRVVRLYYFATAQPASVHACKGYIDLSQVSDIQLGDADKKGNRYKFTVSVPGRDYVLAAALPIQRKEWIQHLTERVSGLHRGSLSS